MINATSVKRRVIGRKTVLSSRLVWKRRRVLQGFISKRRPRENEVSLSVANEFQVKVEFIGVVKLTLESGFYLVLENTVYVPQMRRNLISIPKLNACDFTFNFGNGMIKLFNYSRLIGNDIFCDGLYKLFWLLLVMSRALQMYQRKGL
ncbi:uncharacterized protein LOC111367930 [Olea europaea var. sylvestris]|uniref:uncharacterized protein LOC111367930 n=1 Tax=Olea europaea var. sylvestris TaxID=158386 RepID=UPI000C1D6442|nr:uncharacterized protein LOC111367930 [Olea europaea var. sylvestris]